MVPHNTEKIWTSAGKSFDSGTGKGVRKAMRNANVLRPSTIKAKNLPPVLRPKILLNKHGGHNVEFYKKMLRPKVVNK